MIATKYVVQHGFENFLLLKLLMLTDKQSVESNPKPNRKPVLGIYFYRTQTKLERQTIDTRELEPKLSHKYMKALNLIQNRMIKINFAQPESEQERNHTNVFF